MEIFEIFIQEFPPLVCFSMFQLIPVLVGFFSPLFHSLRMMLISCLQWRDYKSLYTALYLSLLLYLPCFNTSDTRINPKSFCNFIANGVLAGTNY